MSAYPLLCHPASPGAAVQAVAVDAALAVDGRLTLHYRLHARPADIRLPAPLPPAAADNLWQHTCCEAFIAPVDGSEYREFNFSPSGQWAAYRFTDYRQRDMAFHAPVAPTITMHRAADHIALAACLAPALLPAGPRLHIGLSVVIEATTGDKSYWALAHGAAQPDFHFRQSFALTLLRNTP